MNNATLQLKVKQRLNKLSSNDYSNIDCWQIVEAFNKGMTGWCRRTAHGNNLYREGVEQSIRRIDDLQKILIDTPVLPVTDKGIYFETNITDWPTNYLEFSRFICMVSTDCCNSRLMTVYLAEEANIDSYLQDKNRRPNFEWSETFGVIKGNTIQIYHDNQFQIDSLNLVYYRQPTKIQIAGCKDPYSNIVPALDVECEFKEDLCELLIDEAVKILAGDTENNFQYQRSDAEVKNND